MSLRARLTLMSLVVLVSLLLVGGAFQYFALGAFVRQDEAATLDKRLQDVVRRNLCAAASKGGVQLPAARATCLAQALSGGVAGQAITAVIVDVEAAPVASSPCAIGDCTSLSSATYVRALNQARQGRAISGHPYTVASAPDGSEQLAILRPLGPAGRPFALAQLSEPLALVSAAQQRLLWLLVIATAVLVVLAGIILPFLVGRALRPLRRVTDASSALARGDLSRRVIEPSSSDELGQLARSFNDMAQSMQTAIDSRAENEANMRRFAGDASHELRTPLTTIQGHLDVLQRGAVDDPAAREQAFASMQREVHRMSGLVDDLLMLTRLDMAGARQLVAREPVDVDALVAETVDDLSVRAPDQRVEVEPAPANNAVVVGDREQLRRVISNLSDNALKYAPGGRHAWSTAVRDGRVQLRLNDQGPGIPAPDLPRIFDRFYRARDGSSSPGSGLGLAIVRSIVEAHGGKVSAESSPLGTAMTIDLPRRD